jgi:hypothetical protein
LKSKSWRIKKLEKAIDALIELKSETSQSYDIEIILDKLNSLLNRIYSE